MENQEVLNINNYLFEKPLSNENGGFSMWGLGNRGKKTYFVKGFLKPVFPLNENGETDTSKSAALKRCDAFCDKKISLYKAIHEAADGNIVEIHQFFRSGTKFYISTEAITEKTLLIEKIAALSYEKRLQLCCQVASSFASLHRRGVVHADIKPTNILVVNEKHPRARIIDFDAGFLESDPPAIDEELNGDFVYMAPEACLHIQEVESNLTCKMDVFALGILFHQYLTGHIPSFDRDQYDELYEVALEGAAIELDAHLAPEISSLLRSMLQVSPELRPDAEKVFQTLHSELMKLPGKAHERSTGHGTAADHSGGYSNSYMHMAGEL